MPFPRSGRNRSGRSGETRSSKFESKPSGPFTWPVSVTSVRTRQWARVSTGCSDGRRASESRLGASSRSPTTTPRKSRRTFQIDRCSRGRARALVSDDRGSRKPSAERLGDRSPGGSARRCTREFTLDVLAPGRFHDGNVELALEVHPELGTCAEVATEAHGGLGSDGALAAQDCSDPVGGHPDRERELVGARLRSSPIARASGCSRGAPPETGVATACRQRSESHRHRRTFGVVRQVSELSITGDFGAEETISAKARSNGVLFWAIPANRTT